MKIKEEGKNVLSLRLPGQERLGVSIHREDGALALPLLLRPGTVNVMSATTSSADRVPGPRHGASQASSHIPLT